MSSPLQDLRGRGVRGGCASPQAPVPRSRRPGGPANRRQGPRQGRGTSNGNEWFVEGLRLSTPLRREAIAHLLSMMHMIPHPAGWRCTVHRIRAALAAPVRGPPARIRNGITGFSWGGFALPDPPAGGGVGKPGFPRPLSEGLYSLQPSMRFAHNAR